MSSVNEELGHLIKRAQHRHHRTLDTMLASTLGTSLVQWNALREIDRHPGSSQHALAELTFNSDQAFGTLVTRLLKLGLVSRASGSGRALTVQLTGKGKQVLKSGGTIMRDVLAESFAPLSPSERETLTTLLRKMLS